MIRLAIRTQNPTIAEIALKALHILDGNNKAAYGIHVEELYNVELVAGEYDADFKETKAPVYVQQRHFNVVVSSRAFFETTENIEGEDVVIKNSTADDLAGMLSEAKLANSQAVSNKNESVFTYRGVQIVDMGTVNTPENVIL